jgi:hypothetical protein
METKLCPLEIRNVYNCHLPFLQGWRDGIIAMKSVLWKTSTDNITSRSI